MSLASTASMSLASTLRKAAFAAPFVFALAASNANAIDNVKVGQCYPSVQVLNDLKNAGQKSVIFANRVWVDQAKKQAGRKANIITSNADGSLGYWLESPDTYFGEGKQAEKFCVVDNITSIYMYNAKGDGVPREIPSSSSLAKIVSYEIDKNGNRPVLVAKRNQSYIVLSANPDLKDQEKVNGVVFEGSISSPAAMFGNYAQVRYSQNVNREDLPTAYSATNTEKLDIK